MIRHKVEQGESITSIAFRYGFFPDTLWQHADNAELRKLRTDGDILLPGDIVTVPPLRIRQQDGETGKRHRFKRRGVPARTRMQIFDENGPRASQNYVLSIDGR